MTSLVDAYFNEISVGIIGDCNFEKGFCNWRNWKNKVHDQFDWEIGIANDPHHPAGKTHGQPYGEIYLQITSNLPLYIERLKIDSAFTTGLYSV